MYLIGPNVIGINMTAGVVVYFIVSGHEMSGALKQSPTRVSSMFVKCMTGGVLLTWLEFPNIGEDVT